MFFQESNRTKSFEKLEQKVGQRDLQRISFESYSCWSKDKTIFFDCNNKIFTNDLFDWQNIHDYGCRRYDYGSKLPGIVGW